jgi:ATP-dependent Clp protease ATP-binding subunit ClpC
MSGPVYEVAGAVIAAVPMYISWSRQRSAAKLSRMFTPRAKQVLALARRAATSMNHHYTGPEHLLLGIIVLGQGMAVEVLKSRGLDLQNVARKVEEIVGPGPESEMNGDVPYTPRTKKTLMQAMKEANRMRHNYVGTEHILLELLGNDAGVASLVFKEFEVDIDTTRNQILTALAQQGN